MLLFYGMRRGEVLGLRWCDVDLDTGVLSIENQLQRIDGKLTIGPVKTDAGRRQLPIVPVLEDRLRELHTDDVRPEDLVFQSTVGTPIDPKNFVRTFHQICEAAGLRRITVHHTRHTAATMLKDLGVDAKDAQLILGHAHVSTTQQLYQHGDITRQTRALGQLARS
jgi:integrase